MDAPKLHEQPRVVRVFVSSTFRDMQAERDELVKYIFPQLRKLCENRSVTWGEVDLRWGITDEQRAEGKVLPICLNEIQRCRPYFIGLLGERYGWIPEEIPCELAENEPWLAEHRGHSVTELEILHGVLNNPEMAEHAFFYFRDPDYLKLITEDQKFQYREESTPDEIHKFGREETERRILARKQKLRELKDRILKSGFPVTENYRDPKQLGEYVLRDLTKVIQTLFPERLQPNPLDREKNAHELFAANRAKIYIGRPGYFDQLDEHANGKGSPLVVLGDSGSGKSALVANWGLKYRNEHPDDLLLMHFVGATSQSTDWPKIIGRLMGEFNRCLHTQFEIPDTRETLLGVFKIALQVVSEMVTGKGKVILIIDALNELEEIDGALDLGWIPSVIPSNIRMILTTLPGRPLTELKKRKWPELRVERLELEERKQLIKEYLGVFTKSLSPGRSDRIASARQCQNPLYLRALLDELRVFGIYEELDDRINDYLKADSIPALYEKILARCEKDYELDRPGLVGKAMSLLWASRHGLSETELMELLGTNGQPLPHAYWSGFYLSMEQVFLDRGGLINFFHDYIRQAVKNRYIPDQHKQKNIHLRLACYFASKNKDSIRRIEELPWQYAKASEWQLLIDLLRDLDFFEDCWKNNYYDVTTYWAQIENYSPGRLLESYPQVLSKPDDYVDYLWDFGNFFKITGHASQALTIYSYLVRTFREKRDESNLRVVLGLQAEILCDLDFLHDELKDLDKALKLYKEQEELCRESSDLPGLLNSLGGQAYIHNQRGNYEVALEMSFELERSSRQLGDLSALQSALGMQAGCLESVWDEHKTAKAFGLYVEQEKICRQIGNMKDLANSLNRQSRILHSLGKIMLAAQKTEEANALAAQHGLTEINLSVAGRKRRHFRLYVMIIIWWILVMLCGFLIFKLVTQYYHGP